MLTLGKSERSSGNNLGSLKGEGNKGGHQRRFTEDLGGNRQDLRKEYKLDYKSEYNSKEKTIKIGSISGHIMKDSDGKGKEKEKEIIDDKVVSKFKKLKNKRKDRDSLNHIILPQNTKKLVPIISMNSKNESQLDKFKFDSNPIISGRIYKTLLGRLLHLGGKIRKKFKKTRLMIFTRKFSKKENWISRIGMIISEEFFKKQIKDNQERHVYIDNVWDKNSKSLKNIEKMKDEINNTKIPKKPKKSKSYFPKIKTSFHTQKTRIRLHFHPS
jgi:hypothetical protein